MLSVSHAPMLRVGEVIVFQKYVNMENHGKAALHFFLVEMENPEDKKET